MDPKISKKTQDLLGKIIKKPPLTDKLLAKPPFRFLHDIMTSVIKTTGVMKGLYTESEMNSENVKDKDAKIAFLQKAVDFVSKALGKQLSVKPAKVVAGHEPEKTNEFLQALAQVINSKVDNDDVIGKMNGKEEKEDKREKSHDREKSGDRRKRDEDKKGREKSEDRHKEKEDRHKDKEDRHRSKDEKHREKDDKHKEKDRDRERERESRHKSGRSRQESCDKGEVSVNVNQASVNKPAECSPEDSQCDQGSLTPFHTPDDPLNITYAVDPLTDTPYRPESTMRPTKPIPRQISTYQEFRPSEDDVSPIEAPVSGDSMRKSKRPKAAKVRRGSSNDIQKAFIDGNPIYVDRTADRSADDDMLSKRGADEIEADLNGFKESRADIGDSMSDVSQAQKQQNVYESPIRSAESYGKGRSHKIKGPKTSTPKNSPDSQIRLEKMSSEKKMKGRLDRSLNETSKQGEMGKTRLKTNNRRMSDKGSIGRAMTGAVSNSSNENSSTRSTHNRDRKSIQADDAKIVSKTDRPEKVQKSYLADTSTKDGNDNPEQGSAMDKEAWKEKKRRRKSRKSDQDKQVLNELHGRREKKKKRSRQKYSNDDYAHDKIKKNSKRNAYQSCLNDSYYDAEDDQYELSDQVIQEKGREEFVDNTSTGRGTKDSHIHLGSGDKREDDSKENDGPSKDMVNGDHKPTEAVSTRMQRPSSAKGSRRRMEDVPMKKNEPTLKEDDLPPQVASRLARPSSARPAPPKRKDDIVQNEPAMRLGSGKPQNLIIDDGKDSDEDETFVVEESAPLPTEPEPQPRNPDEDDDDEDHGGLVKKIMETKKEYEQQRKTEIERPTISDAQRRKQREAVQKEIDKLRNSIQTLTRSANPLGKIMDYVQEDLDSMQKELEKWKAENKEHALALKREKAITERAVEPLKVQLTQVDQAIKDQLDLIGAVKSNIIRNDQKIEKMLRTIAKS